MASVWTGAEFELVSYLMDCLVTEGEVHSLETLVQLAQQGSKEAFEQLVRLYQRDVRLIVRRCLGAKSAADDVAQEVFVQMYRSLASYRHTGSIRAWILGITRNCILTYLRNESKRRRLQETDLASDLIQWRLGSLDTDPFELEEEQRDLDALKHCIGRLGDNHQQIIHRYYFQNQTAESIAQQDGRKAGTVRMMLLRIRKALGECIQRKRSRWSRDHGS